MSEKRDTDDRGIGHYKDVSEQQLPELTNLNSSSYDKDENPNRPKGRGIY